MRYTDGVIETRDPGGGFYPLTERVLLLLARDPQNRAGRIAGRSGGSYRRPAADDAAMLLLHRQNSQSP
ncbi:SpoIIE family protein phosphatase [Nonomuraea sp. SYSU D8015]|uniref:SpoIIE family protein phosphatase n=1 Tax=Nonomuraea sp. SYSU D8015 TaxID=2593644 RepID=UPI003FA54FA8